MINIPFIILLFFAGLSLVINLVKHGQPKPDYNAYTAFIGLFVELFLIVWAIWWGFK